jgi:hypothetical protein
MGEDGRDGVGEGGSDNTIGIAGLAVGGVGIVMAGVAIYMNAQKRTGIPYAKVNDSPRSFRVVRVY